MKKSLHRINIRTIRNLKDCEGITLKNGYVVQYKSVGK